MSEQTLNVINQAISEELLRELTSPQGPMATSAVAAIAEEDARIEFRRAINIHSEAHRNAMLYGSGRIELPNEIPMPQVASAPTPHERNFDATAYIRELSELMDVNSDDWDYFDIFGIGNGDELITDKNEINRRFIEKVKSKTAEPPTDIPPSILRKLRQLQLKSKTLKTNELYKQVKESKRVLRSLVQQRLDAEFKLTQAMSFLERKNHNLISEVSKMSKFFEINAIDTSEYELCLYTKDCVITWVRPGDLKKFKINFGQFKIQIDPGTLKAYAFQLENNVFFKDHYHPFISDGGSICFGESSDAASEFAAKGMWSNYLTLLQSLLCSYSHQAFPYVALETFWYLGKDEHGKHPWREDSDVCPIEQLANISQNVEVGCSECGSEDHEIDECEDRHYCEDCDASYSSNSGHDCPYITCEDCDYHFHEDDSHNCTAECDGCGLEYGRDGRGGHTCPEEEPVEQNNLPF